MSDYIDRLGVVDPDELSERLASVIYREVVEPLERKNRALLEDIRILRERLERAEAELDDLTTGAKDS